MTEPRSMKDWQVEESSDPDNQWQLLETEQELPNDLTLQETGAPQQEWRPVEYAEPQSSGGRNWILPSFIILAMIAVVAYIAWLGLNGVGFLPPSSTAAEITPEPQEPAVVVMDTPATEEPTATTAPEPTATSLPTPEPSPAPTLVEKLFGTIDSEYGLNIRANPSVDAALLRLAANGEKFSVIQEVDGWLELELADGSTGWVSAEFVNVVPEMVPGEPGSAVEDVEAEPTPVDSVEALEAAPTETTGVTPPEPFTDLIPVGPAVLVLAEGGVNARSGDSTDSDIILTIPQGAALKAVGRNAADDWLQIELPSGDLAWISKDPVETRGEVGALVVVDPNASEADSPTVAPTAEPVAETEAITSTAPAAQTEPLTTTETVTETATVEPVAGEIDAEMTVGLIGVKARTSPSLTGDVAEVLASGTVFPVTGRTSDSTWMAVNLADDSIGWVLIGAVDLNVDPAELPVVEP